MMNGFKVMGDDGDTYWKCLWCGNYNPEDKDVCWSCSAFRDDDD